MQFKLATVTALLAAASSALAVPVAAGIEKITEKVADVADQAEALNIRNVPVKGPRVFSTYGGLLNEKNKQVANAPEGIDPSSEPEVCNAFISYSETEKKLLQAMIRDYDLLKMYGLATPAATLLRSDKQVSDIYYSNTLGLVPSCKDDIQSKGKQVADLFKTAVERYESGSSN